MSFFKKGRGISRQQKMNGFIFLMGFDEIGNEMVMLKIMSVNLLEVIEKWTYFE